MVQENIIDTESRVNHVADRVKLSEIYASMLDQDVDYRIAVYAETDKGHNASLPLNYIVIPKTEARKFTY